MKTIIQTLVLFMLIVPAFAFTAVPEVEAACSGNGYYNSNGRCVTSYSNNTDQFSQSSNSHQNIDAAQIAYMQSYIQQLMALLEQLQNMQSQSGNYGYGSSNVEVTTESARNISDDEVTLRGEVDFNNEDEATVYFEYGRSRTSLNSDTTHVVLDEDDDDEDFSHSITNLRDDTKYYFRAVAEDEDGDRAYGSILSFTTDNDGEATTMTILKQTQTVLMMWMKTALNLMDQ